MNTQKFLTYFAHGSFNRNVVTPYVQPADVVRNLNTSTSATQATLTAMDLFPLRVDTATLP